MWTCARHSESGRHPAPEQVTKDEDQLLCVARCSGSEPIGVAGRVAAEFGGFCHRWPNSGLMTMAGDEESVQRVFVVLKRGSPYFIALSVVIGPTTWASARSAKGFWIESNGGVDLGDCPDAARTRL
jgi:hypothetical protein